MNAFQQKNFMICQLPLQGEKGINKTVKPMKVFS